MGVVRSFRLTILLACAVLVTLVGGGVASADISYVYDELGRLIGVIDPSSDTAVYTYDAVGNLLGIARYASSTVSIIDFQPKSGPVGTTVTIQGTGFSTTPASNSVTFNGTAATVTSSTATSLVTTVPSGATTGAIGVTVSGNSATSASAFTVTSAGGAPTITSFTPTVGVPGASVTITGTNFETVPINNKVAFYGVPPGKTLATSATGTTLVVPVPGNARSGTITVATPAGTVVSSADFFVPVGGYVAADVIYTGRIVTGGSSVDVPLTTTNKQALILFDGTAGQRLDLGTAILSGFGAPVITIYRPDGGTLTTTGYSYARYLPPLPMTGLYVIAMTNGAATHTMRLTLSEEVTATATVGGSAVNATIARVGQRARITFSGTAGQRIDLGMTHPWSSVTTTFKTADETTTLGTLGISSPGELHSSVLPSTGSYLLLVEPNSVTGSFTATLSAEVTGTITIGGSSTTVSITRAGQRARVTFSGTSGQSISLGITSATVSGATILYRPDGNVHNGPTGYSTPSGGVDYAGLVSTGTHALVVDPSGIGTGDVTLTLSELIAGTTALDGTPATVNITRPGQAAYWTFSGTDGQKSSHVVSSTVTGALVIFYSGGALWSGGLPGTTFVEPLTLPSTTTYYIYVDPTGANMGSTTVTSYSVTDVTGSLSINGGTTGVTITTPGQTALLTFSGTSGQAITVRVTGNSIGCTFVSVIKPAGGGTSTVSDCSTSFNFGVNLTTTGTHTLKIDPQGSRTGSVTVEVTLP